MKHSATVTALWVIVCLLSIGVERVWSVPVLHMEEAIHQAFRHNPNLQELSGRIAEAEGHIREAQASYLPQLRFKATAEVGDAPSYYLFHTIDAASLAPNTNFNNPGSLVNFEYGLYLEQELFTWGRRRARLASAGAGREAARQRFNDYANQLVGMIIATYLDILQAQAAHETAEHGVALVKKQLEVVESKLIKEVVLKTDALKLEVRLAEEKERSIKALSAQRQALTILATLVGTDWDQEFVCAVPDGFVPVQLEDKEQATPRPYRVWAAEAEVAMACGGVREAVAGSFPSVGVFARTYLDSPDDPFHHRRTNWVVGCALSWDLYTGGRISAKRSLARAQLGQAEQRLRRERLAVRQQITVAQLKKTEAEERVRVAQIGERSAQESFALVEMQYEEGVAPVTSYLEAEEMLSAAFLRHRSAFYDLVKAEADLLRAGGFLSERLR